MKSILSQLYDGELAPAEHYHSQIAACKKLHEKYYAQYNDLIQRLKELDPPLDKTFARIIDGQFDIIPMEMAEIFSDGFCLGAKMMIKIYQKDLPDQSI